jgi:hypothetical protein
MTGNISYVYSTLCPTSWYLSEIEHNGFRLLKLSQLSQIAKGWVDCTHRGDKAHKGSGEKGVVSSAPPSWIVHHSLARNCYIEPICWQVIQKFKGPCRSSTLYTKINYCGRVK